MVETYPDIDGEDWRQCWRTPRWLFRWLALEAYKRWDAHHCLDMFAADDNALGDGYYTKESSALDIGWEDPLAWYFCNPPFRQLKTVIPFATYQVFEHRARVVMLFQMRDIQTRYIRGSHHWWDKYILYPRLGYVHPHTGVEETSPPAASVLWFSRTAPTLQTNYNASFLDISRIKKEYDNAK